MTVRTSVANAALAQGLFETDRIRDDHFSNGQFHNTALGSDESGVLGELEVGNDAPVEDAAVVIIGQWTNGRPDHPAATAGPGGDFLAGQTTRARPDIEVQQDDDTDVNADTKVAVAGAKQPTEVKPRAMPFRLEAETNSSDQNITDIEPHEPDSRRPLYIAEGEYVNLVVNAGNSSQTFGMDHTTVSLPILKWDGRGL